MIAACQHISELPPSVSVTKEEQLNQDLFPSEPLLRLNPGLHTATIKRADIDSDERFLVSASYDKSVLLWDLETGRLKKTLRVPAGPGNIGKVYAVAMSPDGETIAVGGSTYLHTPMC